MAISYAALFIAAHFIGYLLWVRHRLWGRGEKGIFVYHLCAFAALVSAGLVAIVLYPENATLAAVVGGISLHAIYSITFLEFWSLSQGSFSYAVLARLYPEARAEEEIIAELAALGAEKKSSRIDGLAHLALARRGVDGTWQLTGRGRAASAMVRALLWLPATRDRG